MDRPFYSVTFGDKNTWDEWNLMPIKAGRIEFVTPEVKRESAEIPGADGELDMSEVLTGYPTYENRRGSIKFRFFDNGTPVRSRWHNLKNYLHGRKMRAVVEDDLSFYYEGRFMVGDLEFASRGNWATTEISYDVKPYKLEITTATEDWLWDPFNFETGVIREYREIEVNGDLTMKIIGSRKPTIPVFVVDIQEGWGLSDVPTVNMNLGGVDYTLVLGRNIFPQIILMDQEYLARFTCEVPMIVSVDMQGGYL